MNSYLTSRAIVAFCLEVIRRRLRSMPYRPSVRRKGARS